MVASSSRNPDLIVNGCYVARTKSGWTWLCKHCGQGGITGRGNNWRDLVVHNAREHRCPPQDLAQDSA